MIDQWIINILARHIIFFNETVLSITSQEGL